MAKTKYNHRILVESYQMARTKSVYPGMVLDFKYKGEHIFDENPMVLVLWNDYKKYKIHGINLNYLSNSRIGVLFDKLIEGSKIYNQGKRTGNPFVIQDQDDESGYDDNLPYRNLLKKPYTRMKLPTYRENRGGNPLSDAEAKRQMKVLYEKIIKRFVYRGKDYNVYRTYKYDKMVTLRVLNLNLGKIR
tara:strand:- start:16 stop:582 length:567 start_codon:yes stop_codon:yes gene_type:complete